MPTPNPTFGSVCDGIGCGHLAFNREGYDCKWSAEIEPFPCAVLKERFPTVRNVGNMMKIRGKLKEAFIKAPDVFIGGTPCQAFSIAGKREGLSDARGNLSLEFCRIADGIDAVRRSTGKDGCVVLWENVPGVLSDKGNAFGCFLGMLAGEDEAIAVEKWPRAGVVCGTRRRVAWCVLDSQYFGVAQRRRRVFVVAVPNQLVERLGERADPAEILSIGNSKKRDTPSRGNTRESFASYAGEGTTVSGLRKDTYGQKEIDRAGSLLSDLRSAVGSPSFEEWIRGIGETFLQQKILFGSMQREESVAEDPESDDSGCGERRCKTNNPRSAMQYLWKVAEIRNPPQGSESFEQRAVELNAVVQELSRQTAPYRTFMLCLRSAGEGSQSLYEALASMEKSYQARMGHSVHGIYQEHIGALYARDYKGVGSQYVDEGKCVVQCMAHGQGGAEITKDHAPCLSCNHEAPILFDQPPQAIYENHAQDCRVTGPLDVSPMLSAKICARESGQGYWMEDVVAGTLRAEGENRPSRPSHIIADVIHGDKACNGNPEAYRVTFNDANGTRKDRPNGGCYVTKADVSGCLTQAENEIRIVQDTMATQGVCTAVETGHGYWMESDKAGTLRAEGENRPSRPSHAIATASTVRRITPTECERLQGLPDGHTLIPWRGKPAADCPDGPRYKGIGNGQTVQVMQWLAMRIRNAITEG